MQLLLAERDEQAQQAGYAEQARQRKEGRLRALILAPTRELAMQVRGCPGRRAAAICLLRPPWLCFRSVSVHNFGAGHADL